LPACERNSPGQWVDRFIFNGRGRGTHAVIVKASEGPRLASKGRTRTRGTHRTMKFVIGQRSWFLDLSRFTSLAYRSVRPTHSVFQICVDPLF
jgi:hypothetical protein